MSVEDATQSRAVMREISKRPIDSTLLNVHVSHGVVYLRGVARKLRNVETDMEQEMQIICRILRQTPGIREVINEVTIR
jgi:hypothetical protein